MRRGPDRRRLPDWLVGLLLALVVVAVAAAVLRAAGAGDDPAFEPPTGGQGLVLPVAREG